MLRRNVIAAAAVVMAALIGGCSASGGATAAEGDIGTGAPAGAKVTVIEYASVTCGACAAWQAQTYAAFKAKYIDTGKVRFVFREFPTGPVEVAAAGFLTARCAGEDKYLDVVHELMASQQEMLGGGNPRTVLLRVANAAGLSEEQFTQCVTNPDNIAALEARSRAAIDAGISGTPTFLVNGVTTGRSLEELSAAIDAELAK
ncbi:DsbA family protein [Brevundimonas variabilis]|uniref:Protein-disulfide isomerase n=1 Tax=Brevundimonas variabilis TaxID=74312 RepID=A0A7W9CJU8_9CAUL|nr:DsbA family protein [Brevundimonas variabilis]MBB5746522.1 protein-disulfide isomerase [Brevundimonas variabilis]